MKCRLNLQNGDYFLLLAQIFKNDNKYINIIIKELLIFY